MCPPAVPRTCVPREASYVICAGSCLFPARFSVHLKAGVEIRLDLSCSRLSVAADVSVFFRSARSSYRSGDAPVTAASLDSGLSGSAYSLLDEEEEANEVDSAIFQVPRL